MANKRIELEQYKYFVDLMEEQPNRKRMRSGLTIAMVVSILLVTLLLILGFMSNELSKNPRNVLEKPPEKSKEIPQQSGNTTIPNVPQQEIPVPSGGVPQSGSTRSDFIASNIAHSGLIAQAETSVSAPERVQKVKSEKSKKKGPGQETKGVGNLSNLSSSIDGRGFYFYVFGLCLILYIVFYIVIRRFRREGK
ncbi:MAG: hypothetical protein PHP64_07305 [Actinomycetota bacterium]|nr:hypothetical protein [Actinomycetota bacterium]